MRPWPRGSQWQLVPVPTSPLVAEFLEMNALQTDRLRWTLADATRTGQEISLLLQASDLLVAHCRRDLDAFGSGAGEPSPFGGQQVIKDVQRRISVSMGLDEIAAGLARTARGHLSAALWPATGPEESAAPPPDLLSVVDCTRQVLELVESAVAKNDHWLAVAIDKLQQADARHEVTPELIDAMRCLLRHVGRRSGGH